MIKNQPNKDFICKGAVGIQQINKVTTQTIDNMDPGEKVIKMRSTTSYRGNGSSYRHATKSDKTMTNTDS